ncbi:organic solute transporter alpha-like protein, partial [Aphelenchoides avenae]
MLSPRAAVLVSSLGLLYFLMCLFVLVSLIRHLAEGRAQLAMALTDRGRMVNFQSPPLCCCMTFLPKVRPTETNLRRLEWIVLQAPIVRVVIALLEIIVVAELREHALKWIQICDAASLASILLAVFGIHTLARLTAVRYRNFVSVLINPASGSFISLRLHGNLPDRRRSAALLLRPAAGSLPEHLVAIWRHHLWSDPVPTGQRS